MRRGSSESRGERQLTFVQEDLSEGGSTSVLDHLGNVGLKEGDGLLVSASYAVVDGFVTFLMERLYYNTKVDGFRGHNVRWEGGTAFLLKDNNGAVIPHVLLPL